MIVHLEKASTADLFRMVTEDKLKNVIVDFYHERKSPYDHNSLIEAIFPAFLELMYDAKTAATFMAAYQNYHKSPLYFNEFDNKPFPNPWQNLSVTDRILMFERADPLILGQLVNAYRYQHQLRLYLLGSRDSYENNMLNFSFYYRECFSPVIVSAEFATDMDDLLGLNPQTHSFKEHVKKFQQGLVDVWSASFDRLVYVLQSHLIDTFVDHVSAGTIFIPVTDEERERAKNEILVKRMHSILEQYVA